MYHMDVQLDDMSQLLSFYEEQKMHCEGKICLHVIPLLDKIKYSLFRIYKIY